VTLDADACYRALVARDDRFDGTFFVGVKTTGIYCRPVCRARTPGRDRCVFYQRAVEAERDGFRACFRCRPERAPGDAPVDALSSTVKAAVAKIEAGALNDGDVEGLAAALGITSRHLRRAMSAELGVSPLSFALSRRVALARELLLGTSLPVTDIAFASGWKSLRRFNAAFRAHQGVPPSALRRARPGASGDDAVRLTLDYRPPFDWNSSLAFFRARTVRGVESLEGDTYRRTVRAGPDAGYISITKAEGRASLYLDVAPSLTGGLMPVVARVRRLFDLDAHPAAIGSHLAKDPRLAALVGRRPGLRLPGSFDPFEAAVRAVLGQQVSVAAATTLATRLVQWLGEPVKTPFEGLDRIWPTPDRIASASEGDLASLGLTGARARTLRGLAAAVAGGDVSLDGAADPEATLRALTELPGIGDWTAHYIAMRALGWPDAFPASDLGVRKALAMASPAECLEMAERWRPWRAYAVIHLWTSLA
jgi:AraC family transcriptional regulator of adaptative response / DNA-3-methyladenine glycosylase II